jgi:(2Fe-2S) ferredoxin
MPKSRCMILPGLKEYVYRPFNFLGGILTNIRCPPSTVRRVLRVLYEMGDQLCGIEIWHTQHTCTRVDRLVSEHLSTRRKVESLHIFSLLVKLKEHL